MATREIAPIAQSTVASTTEFGDFKPIIGDTGSTLYVLTEGANQPTSMKRLQTAGLMPFTETEILRILVKDEQLKSYLKGK